MLILAPEFLVYVRHSWRARWDDMNPVIDEDAALNELVAKGLRIPPWPKVLMELQQVLSKGAPDARTLARIIGKDPGLAAMVFKAARSSLVPNGKKKLERLDQVLMMLGTKQVLNLVRAVALNTALSDANRKSFNLFWARSAEIADLAAIIADERVSICNVFPDQAYLAAIFWECGIPVLMQRFPDYCTSIALDKIPCWPSIHEEDQRFSVDHCAIGYLVARHWKLPDFIASAIYYHGTMPGEEHGAVRSLVAILHLASHWYQLMKGAESEHWDTLESEVLAELGVHVDDLEDLRADVEERFHVLR